MVSTLEWKVRQFALAHVAPAAVSALSRLSQVAETRFRRSFATQRHVRGRGIEIGAAATPAFIPKGSSVKYVDKYDFEEIAEDDELKLFTPVRPDIKASAERLEGISENSQDFVIAFSMLEHSQDALSSIFNFHRVTRSGGTVIVSVPDKRSYGPDKLRPLTTFDHFIQDYVEGPEGSREAHVREAAAFRRSSPEEIEEMVRKVLESDGHTHFHVWDSASFLDFIVRAKAYLGIYYEIKEFANYGHESLAVLKIEK